MGSQDYHAAILAPVTASEAMARIGRVSDWWTRGFEGKSRTVGDTFTVRFGKTFVDFRISEVVPGKKIVWEVADCNLDWIRDKKEWKGTTIVWEISSRNGLTEIGMTHVGLVPEQECYTNCKPGWDFYVTKSLQKLLEENIGLPDREGK